MAEALRALRTLYRGGKLCWRRSAIAGDVVRGRDLERDPLDRMGEARRADPATAGRQRASSLDVHEAFIVGLIDERKDITLNEMVERLVAERSVRISRSALSAWLRGHGWTFKKSPYTHWSRIAPTS